MIETHNDCSFQIQLTLFLKDVGLPVHHAIALWRGEYSRPAGAGSRCSHSWQSDGRRYTYSIRHLYGLEGGRRNYKSHCCQALQVNNFFFFF
jgi:DNA primase large subunit